ncbi:MAG: ABC transporter ATP-binding protein [Armatimonadota bacterium]
MSVAIEVKGLWKAFNVSHQGIGSIKGALVDLIRRGRRRQERIWGLQDVNLLVEAGESVAVIGRNGSGKSTLLGILSRVYKPTKGEVRVNGRVSSLLELGAGFHPDLTGIENIYLNGSILGLSRREITRKLNDIIEFSELGSFIDAPLKTYSLGMQMRLGFSVAVQTDPDVLLVDEVLAVGDEAFQQKCYRTIERFQKEGRTILFVSHDLEAVRRVAPRSVWLDSGRVVMDGPTPEVTEAYVERMRSLDEAKE